MHEDEIEAICLKIIEDYPKQVEYYLSGKTAFGFLVGQVHRITEGRALPRLVEDTMRRLLEAREQRVGPKAACSSSEP